MDNHYHVLEKMRNRVLGMPNVRGVGVGYKRVGMMRTEKPAIIVFVEKKVPARGLRRGQHVPKKLKGLDTDVIEIGCVRLLERIKKFRPALPGSSIGHYKVSAGTFGAVVKDKKTGEKVILSNCHILANRSNGYDDRAKEGDSVLQPGSYDGGTERDRIANLYRYIPIIRSSQQSDCPVASGVSTFGNKILKIIRPSYELRFYKNTRSFNIVDCAVAKPVNPDLIGEEIIDIGRVSGVGVAREGMEVRKSGRTSGVTSGDVTAVGVTLKVDLSDEETGWFSDQVVADLMCQPGDSGSLVLNKENQAVGLLFAGSDTHCIFNRIQNVMDYLEVEF